MNNLIEKRYGDGRRIDYTFIANDGEIYLGCKRICDMHNPNKGIDPTKLRMAIDCAQATACYWLGMYEELLKLETPETREKRMKDTEIERGRCLMLIERFKKQLQNRTATKPEINLGY